VVVAGKEVTHCVLCIHELIIFTQIFFLISRKLNHK